MPDWSLGVVLLRTTTESCRLWTTRLLVTPTASAQSPLGHNLWVTLFPTGTRKSLVMWIGLFVLYFQNDLLCKLWNPFNGLFHFGAWWKFVLFIFLCLVMCLYVFLPYLWKSSDSAINIFYSILFSFQFEGRAVRNGSKMLPVFAAKMSVLIWVSRNVFDQLSGRHWQEVRSFSDALLFLEYRVWIKFFGGHLEVRSGQVWGHTPEQRVEKSVIFAGHGVMSTRPVFGSLRKHFRGSFWQFEETCSTM